MYNDLLLKKTSQTSYAANVVEQDEFSGLIYAFMSLINGKT